MKIGILVTSMFAGGLAVVITRSLHLHGMPMYLASVAVSVGVGIFYMAFIVHHMRR